ncbi:unnamed protein product [Macrosiphum euphorbiae]|uniref:Uncharacterized protein n=1 Tax=Macrosiphum euphorbiae TaxID=13131 RepID=A0AAV0WP82_9HEMI|nr:unnamed protein product [Macrosiphum euphorbiae]
MQSGQNTINELTIGEPKGELTIRGLGTMGTKSVLFPIQLKSTMVTTSITNVITSTSCTNTNTRGQKPPTPGHWENQNHGVGFPNNDITRNNGPYTVTYGENPTERDNTYQTMIRDRPEESNLLPRENLQAAKDALPEYSGKKEEDPTRFLNTTRDVLLEAKIPRQRWVKVLAPQLKGDFESQLMVGENKSDRPHMGRIPQRIHQQVQRTTSQSETAHRIDGVETILWTSYGGLCVTKNSAFPKTEHWTRRGKCSGDHHTTNETRTSEPNQYWCKNQKRLWTSTKQHSR